MTVRPRVPHSEEVTLPGRLTIAFGLIFPIILTIVLSFWLEFFYEFGRWLA